MESEVDSIRVGNVWIGACANIQQQPKRTGGSRIEERAIRKGLVQELLYAQDTQVMPEDSLCARHTVEFVNPT